MTFKIYLGNVSAAASSNSGKIYQPFPPLILQLPVVLTKPK